VLFLKMLDQIVKSETSPVRPVLRPDPVFIIGMHRSGTSALGGALEALGLTVGKTVMPPNSELGNPKGYCENHALMHFHDRFLTSIGSKWWDAQPVDDERFSDAPARQFREELLQLLVDEFGQNRPLIKDPRMCRLMPLWLPLINEYFTQARFVLPIRHPLEVAYSLNKRDGFKLDLGLKLWVVHALEGERTTRGLKRVFTTYDQLVQSPIETVARLAQSLDLPPEAVTASVPGQIDPGLRHHKKPFWPFLEPHKGLTLSIHRTLVSEEAKREEKLDGFRIEYYRHMGWKC